MEGDDALFVSCFWGAGLISENSIANGLISGQKLTILRSAIKICSQDAKCLGLSPTYIKDLREKFRFSMVPLLVNLVFPHKNP